MIVKAKQKIKTNNVKFVNSTLEKFKFPKSDFISSIYTIQFISPSRRQTVFDKIYKNLNWGGSFFYLKK